MSPGLVGNHLDVPTAWTDLHLVSAPPLWDMAPITGRVKRILPCATLRLREDSELLPRCNTRWALILINYLLSRNRISAVFYLSSLQLSGLLCLVSHQSSPVATH
jgi:hypothetical protein